ncbi:MAG TPA: transcriptional repressor LexA, partial [Phototrophicaceae bacterium]|nr:transcriptional repressor LexA [Phototrophicaceae bacterium]
QRNILRYMDKYMVENGFPPTIRQIGEATGINSTSVVNYNLNKLVQAGYLTRSSHVARGLRMVGDLPGADGKKTARVAVHAAVANVQVPLYGNIYASEPVPVPEDYYPEDNVEVTESLLGGVDPAEAFALRVKGDSMTDAMIREGDIVILRSQQTANNGDMVAVWLEDRSETTLKYFFREGSRIKLQPAHPHMEPIYVDPNICSIRGKVLSVIRQI